MEKLPTPFAQPGACFVHSHTYLPESLESQGGTQNTGSPKPLLHPLQPQAQEAASRNETGVLISFPAEATLQISRRCNFFLSPRSLSACPHLVIPSLSITQAVRRTVGDLCVGSRLSFQQVVD